MRKELQTRNRQWNELILSALLTIAAALSLGGMAACSASIRQTEAVEASTRIPTPTPDRMAEPILPESPTQYEQGRHLYWLNCMPCHGDRGQGLTDEFRGLWVEDHQNCWARGCHAGRAEDQGFLIPRMVPAVISSSGNLPRYTTAEGLFEYLRTTHPPQDPGYLPEDEYWAITAYILTENKRLQPGEVIGP